MLIIQSLILKVKNLTLLSQKKMNKRREFWPRLQKISGFARFFFSNLVSRFGASPNINQIMAIFSPQPLKKFFFVKVTPPPPGRVKM